MATKNAATEYSPSPIVGVVSDTPFGSDNNMLVLPHKKSRHRRSWWRRLLSFFTIEPLTFLYGISSVVASVYFTEQVKLRVCGQELGYNTTTCNMVGQAGDHPGLDTINAEVQKRWATWVLYQRLVSCLPAAILTGFAGAWSDNFGRKPPMVLVLIGLSISNLFGLWFVMVPTLPLYVTLFYALFQSLLGNWAIMLMCIVAYIADVSTDAKRTVRIAIAEGGIGVGAVFGAILGSVLIQTSLPQLTMIVACAINILSLFIVVFLVRETRQSPANIRERMQARYPEGVKKRNATQKFGLSLLQLFTLDNLREAYATATKPRPHHTRIYIGLSAVAMFLFMMQMTGEQEVLQEYFEFRPISWTYAQYQHYVSGFGVVEMISLFLVYFILSGYFHVRDTIVMILGAISCTIRALIMIFATTPMIVYVASGVGVLKYLNSISYRVCVSKLVGRDEQGRGFALIAIAETLAPLAGNLAYATLLTRGVDWKWTNVIFLVTSTVWILQLIITIIVCVGTWSFYMQWSSANGKQQEQQPSIAALQPRASLTGVASTALHQVISGNAANETGHTTFLEPHIGFVEDPMRTDGAPSAYNANVVTKKPFHVNSIEKSTKPDDLTTLQAIAADVVAATASINDEAHADKLRPAVSAAPRCSSFVTEHSDDVPDYDAPYATRPLNGNAANNYNEREIQ